MSHPFRHLGTVNRHRRAVRRHCRKAGIFWQGLVHDLSKFSPTEFFAGAKYYQGTRSPNEAERETLGYSAAWMHHKGRNKHHWEYWRDIDPVTHVYAPVEMPVRYAAEMFCDRVAACKIYRGKSYRDGDALSYFERGHAKDLMHPATSELLGSWLKLLADAGEEAAFAAVRAAVKEEKKNRKQKEKEKKKAE